MNLYNKLVELQQEKIPMMMVTVVSKKGASPVDVGKKMLYTSKGAFGTVGGGALEYAAMNLCKTLLITKENRLVKYILDEGQIVKEVGVEGLPMACGGVVELFYEYVGIKGAVTIFGGGHVGKALCHVLKTMPFYVTIVENRDEVAATIQGADEVVNMSYADYIDEYGIEDDGYVIICTPSHTYDYNVMHKVIENNYHPKYIGMLCSKIKLEDFMEKTYETFGKDVDLGNFYSPIGLDTGGNMPEEIAISIAAEILAVMHNKSDHKHMRNE